MTPFQKRLPSLTDVRVFMGMPIGRVIEPETHFSVLQTAHALVQKGVPVIHSTIKGNSIIELARSRVCEEFLGSDCTHLFMLDSDQVWKPEAFLRILSLGVELPVVCGAYPWKKEPIAFQVSLLECPAQRNSWGCIKIGGTGLGFTCVQRKAIERLAEKAPKLKVCLREKPLAHIFRCDTDGKGEFRGEDVAFFQDCISLGYDVWLDPSVRVGHMGPKEYVGNILEATSFSAS